MCDEIILIIVIPYIGIPLSRISSQAHNHDFLDKSEKDTFVSNIRIHVVKKKGVRAPGSGSPAIPRSGRLRGRPLSGRSPAIMAGPSSHVPGHLPGHGRHYGRPLSVWSPAIVVACPAWPALWPASLKTSISCLGPLPFSSKPSTRVSPPLEGTQASPPPLLSIFGHPPSIPCPNLKPLPPI